MRGITKFKILPHTIPITNKNVFKFALKVSIQIESKSKNQKTTYETLYFI